MENERACARPAGPETFTWTVKAVAFAVPRFSMKNERVTVWPATAGLGEMEIVFWTTARSGVGPRATLKGRSRDPKIVRFDTVMFRAYASTVVGAVKLDVK